LLQCQIELKNEWEFELLEQHWDKLYLKQKSSNLLIKNVSKDMNLES